MRLTAKYFVYILVLMPQYSFAGKFEPRKNQSVYTYKYDIYSSNGKKEMKKSRHCEKDAPWDEFYARTLATWREMATQKHPSLLEFAEENEFYYSVRNQPNNIWKNHIRGLVHAKSKEVCKKIQTRLEVLTDKHFLLKIKTF